MCSSNEIDDEKETFEFAGVLTLRWHDKRQVFDPSAAGVDEKVYQGGYQFDEVFTGWFPQVVLVNESGLYETDGVVLRVSIHSVCGRSRYAPERGEKPPR